MPSMRRGRPLLSVMVCIALALLGFTAPTAHSAPPGPSFAAAPAGSATIAGTVTNAVTGSPVASATVTIDLTGTALSVQTDSGGSYTAAVEPGTHTVQASAPGYDPGSWWNTTVDPATDKVILADGQDLTDINIALQPVVVPVPAATIGGAVRATDGTPIDNAWVWAEGTGLETVTSTTTGSDGSYTLSLPAGTYTIHASAIDRISVATESRTVGSGDQLTGVDMVLARAATLTGTVTAVGTETGIPGVVVKLFDATSTAANPVSTATTDSTGAYAALQVPPGTYVVQFDASDTAFLSRWYPAAATKPEATKVTVLEGEVRAGISGSLVRAATISGTVRDDAGAPLPDVFVNVIEANRGDMGWASTGADGRYTTTGLPAGQYTLIFNKYSYVQLTYGTSKITDAREYISVPESASVTVRDMRLPVGGSILGRVTEPDGTAVAHPTVLAYGPGGYQYASSDESGRYSVTGLDSGSYTVRFSAGSHAIRFWQNVSEAWKATPVPVTRGTTTIDINGILPTQPAPPLNTGTVTGKVLDSAGLPIAGIDVQVSCEGTWTSGTTSATGTYTVAAGSTSCTVSFVDPALRFASAKWSDADGAASFDVPKGTTKDLGITKLSKGVTFTGHVYAGTTGTNGLADVRVVAVPADWSQWQDESVLPSVQTDDTGAFTIGALPADIYTLHYLPSSSTGYADSWLGDAPRRARADYLTMPAGSRSTADGRVVRSASLTGHVDASDHAVLKGVYISALNTEDQTTVGVQTDAEGNYTLGGLRPGTYVLSFDGMALGYAHEWWSGATSESAATPVILTAGNAVSGYVTVLAKATTIRGKVADALGRPVPNASISAYQGERLVGWASTESSGTYVLTMPVAGSYTLHASPSSGSGLAPQWWHDQPVQATANLVAVATSANATADFRLIAAATISGMVTRPPGATGEYSVGLFDAVSGSPVWTATSNSQPNGAYEISDVPPGTYTVCASSQNLTQTCAPAARSAATATPITVTSGQRRTGVDITMLQGGTLGGVVRTSAGTPAVASVYLIDATNLLTQSFTTSAADGSFSFLGLAPGKYAAVAVDLAAGTKGWSGGTDAWTAMRFTVAGDETKTDADITMSPPAPLDGGKKGLHGRITLPSGATPDAFAHIEIYVADPNSGYQLAYCSIDPIGVYACSHIADGDYALVIKSNGSSTNIAPVKLPIRVPNPDPVDVSLTLGGTLVGSMQNAAGKPLSGVVIVIDALGLTHIEPVSSRTGWTVTGLPSGPAKIKVGGCSPLYADCGNYSNAYVSQWVGGTHEEATAVAITVVSGESVTMPTTTLQLGGRISGRISVATPIKETVNLQVEVSDTAGHLLATSIVEASSDWPGNYSVGALPSGPVVVRFSSYSWSPPTIPVWWQNSSTAATARTITTQPGKVTERIDQTISLEPSPAAGTLGSISGLATLEGRPLQYTLLQAFDSTGRAYSGWSDEHGRYTIEGLPADAFSVMADHSLQLCDCDTPQEKIQRWWPNVDEAHKGTVSLTAGQQVSNIDIELAPGTAFGAAPIPTITGSAALGQTLQAVIGTWDPAPAAVTYQWLASGTPIPGATAAAYTPTANDVGKAISVQVIATKPGYIATARSSAPTSPVIGPLTAPVPTILGTAKVGLVLTANPGTWGPGTVDLSYQWYRSGVAIAGATLKTYALTAADYAKVMTVRVTGVRTGYLATAKLSAGTAPVAAGTLTPTPIPTIAGTAKVGYVLTARPGIWGPAPVTLTYQWFRSGVAIVGATAATYKLTATDLGKRMTVRVTGARPGYTAVAKVSAFTAVVVAGTLTAPTPTIVGTPRVAYTLTAKPGTWGPAPVTVRYQWLRNGIVITGATAGSYRLTTSDRGKRITVRVTGSKTGYTTVAKVSLPTALVA